MVRVQEVRGVGRLNAGAFSWGLLPASRPPGTAVARST